VFIDGNEKIKFNRPSKVKKLLGTFLLSLW